MVCRYCRNVVLPTLKWSFLAGCSLLGGGALGLVGASNRVVLAAWRGTAVFMIAMCFVTLVVSHWRERHRHT